MTDLTRVEPLLGCKLAGALKAISGIDKVVPIVHGPMGCASGYRIIPLFAGKEPLVTTTALTEMDIIMGADDRLHEAIIKAGKLYNPDAIVIILTCATSLTSDVMSAMSTRIGIDIGIPLFIIDGSGIVGDEIDGFNDFYNQMRKYEEKLPGKDTPSRKIELSGISAADFNIDNDILEIRNIIKHAFGLEVSRSLFYNYKLPKQKEEFLNINIGRLWFEDVDPIPAPVGVNGLISWILHLNELFPQSIDSDYISLIKNKQILIEENKLKFSRLRIGIEAESWWAIGLARFLSDEIGCSVIISSDVGARLFQEKYGEIGITFVDMANTEINRYFKEYKVDAVFGSSYSKTDEWAWIPFWHPVWHAIDGQKSIFGIDGITHLLSVLSSLEDWNNGRKNIHFK